MSKSIIHIAHDEKFIDAAYETYEKAFPNKNLFLILSSIDDGEFKFLSKDKNYQIIVVDNDYLSKIKSFLNNAKVIVFHSIIRKYAKEQYEILKIAKSKNITLIWTVFGYEVYNNPFLFNQKHILGNKSYKIYFENTNWFAKNKKRLKNYLKRRYYKFFIKRNVNHKLKYYIDRLVKFNEESYCFVAKIIREVDVVTMFIKEEYVLYKKLDIIKNEIPCLSFSYFPVNLIITQDYVTSNNILMGNSATPTNNHIEVFYHLKKCNLNGSKIITPLSYGRPYYLEYVKELGYKIFENDFNPLEYFMPLDEYQKLMKKCGIVIMNHYRPQGVGNVLTALHLGAKVYLSKRNNLYHFLKRIGCYIYSIEDDLLPSNDYAFKLLDNEQMRFNRKIINEELNLEKIILELRNNLISYQSSLNEDIKV